MTAIAHIDLIPSEEWIGFWLDLYAPGWRTDSDTDELILVDGPDERGPWMIQVTGVRGWLMVDGEQCYSAAWL